MWDGIGTSRSLGNLANSANSSGIRVRTSYLKCGCVLDSVSQICVSPLVWSETRYMIYIYWSYTLQTHWISRNVMRFFLPWLPFEVGFDQNGIIWENPRVRNVRSFFGRVAWFGWFYISFIVVHRCVAVLCFPQQNFPLWCRRQLAKRKESLDATWDHLTCWSQYVAINNYTILQAISLIVKGDWKIRSCGWGGVYRKLSEGFWSSLRGQGLGDERRRFGLSTAWPYGFASLAPQSLDDGKPIPGPCMEDFAGGMLGEERWQLPETFEAFRTSAKASKIFKSCVPWGYYRHVTWLSKCFWLVLTSHQCLSNAGA